MASSPPRLITVTHEFFPHRGGIAVYTAEMAAGAQMLGYAVEVWAPALPPGLQEPDWPFTVRRLPIDGTHSLRSQLLMAREISRESQRCRDATLYISEPGPLLALMLLQFFETLPPGRLVLTLHGSEILRLGSRPLTSWSARRLFSRADRIGVVSRYAGELLRDLFPRVTSQVAVTPGALRSNFTATPPRPRPAAGQERLVILTVARLHPRKGQLQVIAALRALPSAVRARLEYWLVGSHGKENYEPVLRAAAEDAGFPIKFLGDIPDTTLGDLYARADIFAMTSMPHKLSVEGFGLVYLEAGAHGLPVIAHAIGGVPEAVVHEETGLLVPPDDPRALTAAFARLIEDSELRHRLGSAGRTRALSRDWPQTALALFGPAHPPPST